METSEKKQRKSRTTLSSDELFEKVRNFLSTPEQRGRKVTVREVLSGIDISKTPFEKHMGRFLFAKLWLEINDDASKDLIDHYVDIYSKLEDWLSKYEVRLEEFLSRPENRHKIFDLEDIAEKTRVPLSLLEGDYGYQKYLQAWMRVNEDAPQALKDNIDGQLRQFMTEAMQENKKYTVNMGKGRSKTVHVPVEEVKEKAKYLTGRVHDRKQVNYGKETVTEIVHTTKEMSANDQIIEKIRKAYVMAPLGSIPNVTKIMKGFGLIDKQGAPLMEGITEELVRQRMLDENWRTDRQQHVYRYQDIIPEEIAYNSALRNSEAHRILFDALKTESILYRQFLTSGEVRTLDQKKRLDYQPDPAAIGALAEVMRRVGGGVDTQINLQLNNNFGGGQKGQQTQGAETDNLSLVNRRYTREIENMPEEDLNKEIERLSALEDLLNNQTDETVIDAEFEEESKEEEVLISETDLIDTDEELMQQVTRKRGVSKELN